MKNKLELLSKGKDNAYYIRGSTTLNCVEYALSCAFNSWERWLPLVREFCKHLALCHDSFETRWHFELLWFAVVYGHRSLRCEDSFVWAWSNNILRCTHMKCNTRKTTSRKTTTSTLYLIGVSHFGLIDVLAKSILMWKPKKSDYLLN